MAASVYTQDWYETNGRFDTNLGHCSNVPDAISRRQGGSSGNRNHDCIYWKTSNNLRYNESGDGGHPCKTFETVELIGGGMDGRGDQISYPGDSPVFENAPVGLKCKFNTGRVTDAALRQMYTMDQYIKSGAVGKRGDGQGNEEFRNLHRQLLFGIYADGLENKTDDIKSGFCDKPENLYKEVGGGTCYAKKSAELGNSISADEESRTWCLTNRTDPKCACFNVTGSDFIKKCNENPTWAGCKDVIAKLSEFSNVGITSQSGLFGNAECLVPNICTGEIVKPTTTIPTCQNKLAICNQILDLTSVEARALYAEQKCDINFQSPAPDPAPSPAPSPSSSNNNYILYAILCIISIAIMMISGLFVLST